MRGKNAGSPQQQRERITALVASIRACAQSRDLKECQRIHNQALDRGDATNAFVASTLVSMYSRCGSMDSARAVFDGMKNRDAVSWTCLMSGYVDNGQGEAALRVFGEMVSGSGSCEADRPAFLAALKACSMLATKDEGREGQAARLGLDRDDVFIGSNLVDLYAKCGSLEDSRKVFDRMRAHSVVAWTSLILGYSSSGQPEVALDLFSCMGALKPDAPTLVAAVNACSAVASKERGQVVNGKVVKEAALELGRALRDRAERNGWDSHKTVAAALVDLFAKCGSIEEAISIFEKCPNRNVVSLTALMLGLVENGEPEMALKIFFRTQSQKSFPLDTGAFVAAVKACAEVAAKEEGIIIDGKLVKVEALERGRGLHAQAKKRGWDSDMFLASTMIDMYAKCGSLPCARRVFEGMSRHDVVSWTTLLLGYAENGAEEVALELFASMKSKKCTPDARTFLAVLIAFSGLADKEAGSVTQDGSVVKVKTLERSLELERQSGCLATGDVFLASRLIGLYSKCGSLGNARRVFDKISQHDVTSWTAMIISYVENDDPESAFGFFTRMQDEGFEPDSRTFVAALRTCTSLAAQRDGSERSVALSRGKEVHWQGKKHGLDQDKFVASRIVEMYSICGSMEDARKFFDGIPSPSFELCIELALGYFNNSKIELGVEVFERLMRTRPYQTALGSRLFLAALKACGSGASLETLRTVHSTIIRTGAIDEAVSNSLVDVYGKCSNISDAQVVFDSTITSSSIGWTSLISGYSRSGEIDKVVELFRSMQEEGIRPDDVALTCILSALSHAGLVRQGRQLLADMETKFGMKPAVEHYVCIVDLLGRANELDAALETVKTMPHDPNALIWRTLLGACHKWKNSRIGKAAFEALVKIDKDDAAAYVLMTNLLRWQQEEMPRG